MIQVATQQEGYTMWTEGHDTYTNTTVESGIVLYILCVMDYDWIVGPYPRLIRRVGNHEKLKMNNWRVGT